MTISEPTIGDADTLVLDGLQAHKEGRLDHAEIAYAMALLSKPDHADALNLLGVLAFSSGKIDRAIKLIGQAIRAKPDHLDAHLNLAEAYEAAGIRKEALAICNKALSIAPDFVDAHARLAFLLANNRDIGRSLAHARIALALDPSCVEALCGKGRALCTIKNYDEADQAYKRALSFAPDDLRALTGRAALLRELDLVTEAIEHYRHALAQSPEDANIMASLASLFEIDGNAKIARDWFVKSLKLNPSSVDVRFSFARFLRDTGSFHDAQNEFNTILQSHPKHAPSLFALVRMKRLVDSPSQRKNLSKISTDRTLPDDHRVRAGFALGEVLERAGEYDAAFEQFSKANNFQAKVFEKIGQGYDRTELQNMADRVKAGLGCECTAHGSTWGNPTEMPVFIVGFPRSGTSLVEQICSSHSQITGLGELRAIGRIYRSLALQNKNKHKFADWDSGSARAHADAHAAALASRGAGALRVIDKNPHNLLHLGLIASLYPNARVIRCHRDQRDIAVSNYTLYFKEGNNYSNKLEDCAFAVKTIGKIGDYWRRDTNIRILDVNYEDLISDIVSNTRVILDFLEVAWEDGCLNFHKTNRYVGTPSSWQVRQPVYNSSVARWKNYEKHLGPMLKEFERV